MNAGYACCDEHRRSLLSRDDVDVNGIDWIEIQDNPALPRDRNKTALLVRFFKPLTGTPLDSTDEASACKHLKIYGGERIREITVKSLKVLSEDECSARLELSCQGDLSPYTLAVIRGPDDRENYEAPLQGFDPVFYRMDFRFRPECASSECGERQLCPSKPCQEPEIDYLAKDYSSFRRLMLDRMSHIKPQWKERNTADMGIALVELLAYVGDYLSYQQDAIATEAYIGTSRKRISVRRHARLVDYFMHDGCSSRVYVQVRVNQDIIGTKEEPALPEHTQFLTMVDGQPCRLPIGSLAADEAVAVFETVSPLESLHYGQNEMEFYTWGKDECCLPKGATRATLAGDHSELKSGDILVFEEVLGPKSGEAVDADPGHRHAVMLTKNSEISSDPLGNMLKGSGAGPVPVTEIEWGEDDALPFPLCISSLSDEEHGLISLERVSVALGNIVLADHGRTVRPRSDKALSGQISPKLLEKAKELGLDIRSIEYLGSVPQTRIYRHPEGQASHCSRQEPSPVRPRFNPSLDRGTVTQAARWKSDSASAVTASKPDDALPAVKLIQAIYDAEGQVSRCEEWSLKRDLISSGEEDRDFVVEIDNDGTAFIRFGDGRYGAAPQPRSRFYASYRIGNGISGNVGAGSIAHILCDDSGIIGAWNPLPASGGTEPESVELARMRAPVAFRTQERAVTPEDYAEVAQRFPGVQKAVATFRWTGSWMTVFLTVDRKGSLAVDEEFKAEMIRHMEKFRMAGHDLEVESPAYVSLDLTLTVCVRPEYIIDHVRAALLQRFGNSILPDGRPGMFHPDNLTFGQTIYLSTIYEAALGIEGVESVQVDKFQRRDQPGKGAVTDRKLILGRTEIARLDNDPNFPDRGMLSLNLLGGR